MKKIRKSVYETNSSSTHSICITKGVMLDQLRDNIHFKIGEFGWEYDTLNTPIEKASYLYTAILVLEKDTVIEKIKSVLEAHNIEYSFEDPEYDKDSWLNYGYIDHSGDLCELLDALEQDEDKIMKYLFSSESFVITGNDNSESSVDINVDYDYDEFYKGN